MLQRMVEIMKQNKQEYFLNYQKEVESLGYAMNMLSYECSSDAPKKSIPYTQEVIGVLGKKLIELQSNPKVLKFMEETNEHEFEGIVKESFIKHRKDVMKEKGIPQEVKEEYYKLQPLSEKAWMEAKEKNDFSIYAPYLQKMIDLTKKRVGFYEGDNLFNKVLNEREEGTSMELYEPLFIKIKERIVPLLKQIASKEQRDSACIEVFVEKKKQEELLIELQGIYGFDQEAGKMSASAHPFCSGIGIQNVRFTTHYDEYNPMSAMRSMMHEVGHALYEQQSDLQLNGTFINEKSAAMHEGQSRFYENMIGNNKVFLERLYPLIQEKLGVYQELDFKEFYKALNVVRPSLIRIEADECTYPLHIMIRYELEKKIFMEDLDVYELPKLWNELTKEYLGIDVSTDAEGILQDIHFSWGYFGYFPTYLLGSAFAAQFDYYCRKEVNVDKALQNKDLTEINAWMREHIHQYAGRLSNEEIFLGMKEKFNPEYYCTYLEDKFKEIYSL